MDVQTGLVCVALVIISGAILLLISMFGVKEKTYEEAIAEQRKMPDNALILGRPNKDKNKDKKQKRQGKKVKEKPNSKQKESQKSQSSTEIDSVSSNKQDQGRVNFLSPEAEVLEKSNPQGDEKKKKKKEKIKPILVNKEEPVIVKDKLSNKDVKANHFTRIIPKDDLQLKLTTSKSNQNLNNSRSVNAKDSEKVKEKPLFKPGNENFSGKGKEKEKEKVLKSVNENVIEKGKPKSVLKPVNENVIEKVKEKPNSKSASKENNKILIEKNSKDEPKIINKVQKNKNDKQEPVQQNNNVQQIKAEVKGNLLNSSVEKSRVQQQKINNQQPNKEQKINNQQPNKEQKINNQQPNKEQKINNQQPNKEQKINNQQPNKEQKNKKHKKNELSSLQHISEKDGVNIQLLIPLIRKAELSRTEVQILTDILLTKHFDEVSDHFEWIEGRQDPIVKLKKQLAEKEKALSEEQESSQAFQNKLKELRSEYNAERARLTQACRQYDETILAKQQEIQNLHATNRHMLDNHVAEKQALTQKIQQLQAQVNDENMVIRKLQEDHNQTQNALQQELVNQRQQMEMHIGRLSEQLQDAQKNLEAQIHSKMQEAEQLRASFNAELQKNRMYEEELRELRDQNVQNQNKIKSLESRASQLKETSNHSQELARQIEELQRSNKELEKRLSSSLQLEEELKFEKNKLQNEIYGFTNKVSELQGECAKLMKEKEALSAQVAAQSRISDLEKDLVRVKEENQSLISQVSSFTRIEREAQQLREENENLAAQVTAFTERPAADGRENGDTPYMEERKFINVEFINHENEKKQKDVVLEKLAEELKQKELQIEKLNLELSGYESEISRLSSEMAKYKTEVLKLREELDTQRNKNNDLRQKNWKAMEALSATEKSLESKLKETEKLAQERLSQEQLATKHFLERIFPNIKVDEKAYEDWLFKFENNAKNYLEELQSACEKSSPSSKIDPSYVTELENENSQLLALVSHYKTIIEDTEGMLNKLENHVEQEEFRWCQKFEVLEPQIQTLKEKNAVVENLNEELMSKIKDLEEKIAEREALGEDSVREKCNELRQLAESESEKCRNLAEQIEVLYSELNTEQKKNEQINKELVKLKDTVKFGQDAFVEENKKRLELEEELKSLKSEDNVRNTPINSSVEFLASEADRFDRI